MDLKPFLAISASKGRMLDSCYLGLHGIGNLLDLSSYEKVAARPAGDSAFGQECLAVVKVPVLTLLNINLLLQVVHAAMSIFLFVGQW